MAIGEGKANGGACDGGGGDADGRRDGGEGDADGRRVRRRRRCQRWACATETKAETPMEAKARPMYGGVTETRVDGDGNNCCSDAGGGRGEWGSDKAAMPSAGGGQDRC